MKLFKSLLPEVMFLSGVSLSLIGLLSFTNLAVASIFAGASLLVVAVYLTNVMNVEADEHE